MDQDKDPRTEKVTARILFKGLMAMCINEKKQCEVGFLPCGDHEPEMSIKIMRLGAESTEFKSKLTSDLYIWAVGSTANGVTPKFSKERWSFGCQPDLEALYNSKVTVNRSVLSTRLSVNAGTLYTHNPTSEEYDYVEWIEPKGDGDNPTRFGYLAETTGLNIHCKGKDSGVAIFTRGISLDRVTDSKIWLPARSDIRYEISIDSDCYQPNFPPHVSDFRLYYTSRLIIPPKSGGKKAKKFDFVDANSGRSPDVCQIGYLGKTKTLGLLFFDYDELNKPAEPTTREGRHRKKGR